MKMKEWLPVWLLHYVKPTAKEKTCVRYGEIAEFHLIPYIGELELSEVTPSVLQQMIAELSRCGNLRTGGGLSANSLNAVITVAQSALQVAYRLGYLPEYTADKVKRPKAAEKRIECFTVAEQKKIEQAVLADKRPKMFGVLLALYTGLRIGELLALEWGDIDFQKGELTVSKSCHDSKKDGRYCRLTEAPKTPCRFQGRSCRFCGNKRKSLPLIWWSAETGYCRFVPISIASAFCYDALKFRTGAFTPSGILLPPVHWSAGWT